MADAILIDTDILIDAGRGIADAVQSLHQHEQQSTLAISVITQMELIVGCQNKSELQKMEKFLRRFEVITLDEKTSTMAADLLKQYRLSHGLLIADALIAATALTSSLPLLTKNQRDYRFISGLNLISHP